MTSPAILAFDTSGPHCAAALLSDGDVAVMRAVPMPRGQAEALMPLLQDVLAAGSIDLHDLSAIGVGVGPGNFTGIRISVSAARGLAMSLGIPAIGISTFEVVAHDCGHIASLISLPAPRGQAYVQPFLNTDPLGAPRLIDPAAPPEDLPVTAHSLVAGHRADEIAQAFGAGSTRGAETNIAASIARIAGRRLGTGAEPLDRPKPLYVRMADAAPPSDPPPVILP